MTSSMPEARMFLNELSPITQRSASTRLDLPQPFGPTTPVRPGSILNSALSQKLLKPVRRKRSNIILSLVVAAAPTVPSFPLGGKKVRMRGGASVRAQPIAKPFSPAPLPLWLSGGDPRRTNHLKAQASRSGTGISGHIGPAQSTPAG